MKKIARDRNHRHKNLFTIELIESNAFSDYSVAMKAPSASYNIFIHTPYSVYHLKHIFTEITIAQLKSIIELRTGIPKEHQLLELASKALYDEFQIAETDIKNGSVVRLLFATKVAERLFALANDGDFERLLRIGVQKIECTEGCTEEEQKRLVAWNRNVAKRAFIAVFAACFNGNIQLLANLMKFSAFEINQVTSCGRSALHIAAARGSIGCVCLLLDYGIDPCIEDIDGKTAQEIAKDFDHVHCKRRIWLYRWNIKPTPTAKRRNGNTRADGVRFPSLDGSPNKSYMRVLETEDHDEQEDTILPVVASTRKEYNNAHSPPHPHLQDLNQEEKLSTAVKVLKDPTMEPKYGMPHAFEQLNGQTTLQDNSEKDNEELAMLVHLANKYGYNIIQSKDNVTSENPKSFDEKSSEQTTSGELSGENNVESNTISADKDDRLEAPRDDTEKTKQSDVESQRPKNTSDLKRKISIVSKTNNNKRELSTKNTEMYDIGTELKSLAKQRSQSNPKATKHDIVGNAKKENSGTRELNENLQHEMSAAVVDTGMKGESTGNNARTGKDKEFVDEKNAYYNDEKERESTKGKVELSIENVRDSRSPNSTFEKWLERKAQQKKESLKQSSEEKNYSSKQNSGFANPKEKRQDLCDQAFKNWLQLKRVRYRSASVSPQRIEREGKQETQRPKSGLNFEMWIKKKGKIQPRSFSFAEKEPAHLPIKRAYSCGLSYSEWIESKKSQIKESSTKENDFVEQNSSKTKITGMSFEKWVDSKTRQSQIERVQEENEIMRAEYEKEIEKEIKMKNRNVKTFEEWQLEKKFEDRIRKAKEKKETRRARKNKVKFEADSKLVYNMWLLNKHLNEMEQEEERLIEFREEWEKRRELEQAKAMTRRIKTKSL